IDGQPRMGRRFRLQSRALPQLSLFVDTSVWSLAFRRDGNATAPEAIELVRAIGALEQLFTTGLVLQELLQGFSGPQAHDQIIKRFSVLPLLTPERRDHIAAAELRNTCRRRGIQIGTVDALLAQLCLRRDLTMLTTDNDFHYMAKHCGLKVWGATAHS